MSKQPKKQALLGQAQRKPNNKSAANKKRMALQQQKIAQQQAAQATQQEIPQKPSFKRWITLGVLIIVAILFPKPQLITYEKLGMVATSVYWSGLPGVEPVLFDSALHPRSALDRNTLYLCIDKNDPNTCQKYQIVKKEGVISAITTLISN